MLIITLDSRFLQGAIICSEQWVSPTRGHRVEWLSDSEIRFDAPLIRGKRRASMHTEPDAHSAGPSLLSRLNLQSIPNPVMSRIVRDANPALPSRRAPIPALVARLYQSNDNRHRLRTRSRLPTAPRSLGPGSHPIPTALCDGGGGQIATNHSDPRTALSYSRHPR